MEVGAKERSVGGCMFVLLVMWQGTLLYVSVHYSRVRSVYVLCKANRAQSSIKELIR